MEKEWLQSRVTLAEIQESEPAFHSLVTQRHDWREMMKLMRDGDELWFFSSPPEFWEALMGREGYCLVRDGEIIADVLTMMN